MYKKRGMVYKRKNIANIQKQSNSAVVELKNSERVIRLSILSDTRKTIDCRLISMKILVREPELGARIRFCIPTNRICAGRWMLLESELIYDNPQDLLGKEIKIAYGSKKIHGVIKEVRIWNSGKTTKPSTQGLPPVDER